MADPTVPQLAEDIAQLMALQRRGDLQPAVVKQLIAVSCWWASDPRGRRIACKHWSVNAVEEWKRDPRWTSGRFSHDHVVPRAYITKRIFELTVPTASEIEEWLKLSFECVLTIPEHNSFPHPLKTSMPRDWDGRDAWARYEPGGAWDGIVRHTGALPF